MALNPATLSDGLSAFMDEQHGSFTGFPADAAAFGNSFAQAVANYAGDVTPAVPAPAVSAAEATMASSLTAAAAVPGGLIAGLPAAFTAFAASLALGMQPAFTGTPPASPLVLASVYAAGMAGASQADCVAAMVTLIDTWFRTGVAVNNSTSASAPWV